TLPESEHGGLDFHLLRNDRIVGARGESNSNCGGKEGTEFHGASCEVCVGRGLGTDETCEALQVIQIRGGVERPRQTCVSRRGAVKEIFVGGSTLYKTLTSTAKNRFSAPS